MPERSNGFQDEPPQISEIPKNFPFFFFLFKEATMTKAAREIIISKDFVNRWQHLQHSWVRQALVFTRGVGGRDVAKWKLI